ncbi:MAG: phosphohistidine phosphatase SixA [Methylotenera sp.]
MANLILWRHAEAEDLSLTGADSDRALTKRGRKDAAKMAKWLHQHLPANTEVLSSPARRCQETVAALQQLNHREHPLKFKVAEFLGVDSTVEIIAKKVMNNDSSKTLLLVGHQPNLGLFIAKLLGMNEHACAVKKGAVWWLRQRQVDGGMQIYLFTVQHPDY